MLFSNLFVKNVVQDLTSAGIDWQREKWQSGLGSKFIHQGEKNAAKYADEVIVLSKGVQDYFKETYGRETHFIPNGVNAVWNGDSEGITKEMNALLRRTISYHDYREDFYHAFLAGIFTGAGYMVDSNKEHLAYEKTNQEERKEQPT